MATRDRFTPVEVSWNAKATAGAGTAINTTNGGMIAAKGPRIEIRVTNSTVSAKIVTIAKGTTYQNVGQGDLAASLAANEVGVFMLETARFKQADGDIYLNFETGMTGFFSAVVLP